MSGRRRFDVLTSLRFFAAFQVLIFHACIVTKSWPDLLQGNPLGPRIIDLFSNGYQSVMFFFVLSGFVLAYSLYGPGGEVRSTDPKAFYGRRVARIYPLYLIALLLAIPPYIHSLAADYPKISIALVPSLLQAWYSPSATAWNYPAWSLSIEAAFYAVCPFLVPWLSRFRSPRQQLLFAVGLMILVEIIRVLFRAYVPINPEVDSRTEFLDFFPPFLLPTFIFGVGLADLHRRSPPSPQLARRLFLGCVLGVLVLFSLRSELPAWTRSNLLLTPLFGGVVFGATNLQGSLDRLLSSKFMVLLGDASYALYILHIPLRFYADKLGLMTFPSLFCLFVVGVSICSYKWIEAPITTRAGRRWPAQPRQPRQGSGPGAAAPHTPP